MILEIISGIIQRSIEDSCEGIEASQFDIGTTAIRLVRVGNVIQLVFSSPLEAKYLYRRTG